MAPLSSLVVGLQGIFGILNGAANLFSSSAAEKNLAVLNLISLPALHSIALGSIAIGTFYLNTAYRRDRTMMWLCVAGRAMAIPVFLGHGGPWINVAVFEGVCGILTAGTLSWESWRGARVKAKIS